MNQSSERRQTEKMERASAIRAQRFVCDGVCRWIALLTFSSAALHLKARDRFLNWSARQVSERRHLVAQNSRFLILPAAGRWPNLASRVLKLACERLPEDWREQFGRPLSTFQGTMLRTADAAIDTESIRVTMWQAAWRLDNGLDAALAVSVASWFAAEAGQRAVFATQHLHGGMGADISYPIHRYFLWGKQIELLLGPPSAQLARLGRQVVGELRSGRTVSA